MSIRVIGVFAAAVLLVNSSSASAQYFGRNKVQHEHFNFKVLATEHFDIYYYPEERSAAQLAARLAERWHTRLSRVLNHELRGRQPVVLYAAHPHFQQTNILSGEIGEGTGGVTESAKRRVILPFAGGLAETDHVLGHELVHAFQYDIASEISAQGRRVSRLEALPLWFIEGMAEYLSLGPEDANTAMWIRDASSRNKMPSIDRLDDPDFFPYRYGHAFWAYVGGRWGDQIVGEMLRAATERGEVEGALEELLGEDAKQLTNAWHSATQQTYAVVVESSQSAASTGRPLISRETGGGDLNLAPSLSPDGRRVVFLSERSLFSIDMFLADATTGKVIRKLVGTATDPHFDSLQFLSSAGDWSRDNRHFVFAALRAGQPTLTIMDVDRASREREETFRDLGEIYNPAWSPGGRHIAFSALTGGVLDLYLYDLESSVLRRLTDDPYADLDPEWSPDGKRLVWVTDRFSSDLDTLSFGNYRIAVMGIDGSGAAPLAGFDVGRNTNPEFAADGTLYFIATPDGIPNIYRMPPGGTAVRVTNLVSGIAGITPLSPALSLAAGASSVAFSVFENDHYNIYSGDRLMTISERNTRVRNAAVLPPGERKTDVVARFLAEPSSGLPERRSYDEADYRPRLALDAIAQPTVGVGADRFGAYGAGGVSFLFSDLLGDHTLGATIQATSRLEDTGGAIAYINRRSRWNWGIVAEQTPYTTGGFAQGLTTINGQETIVQETLRITQIDQAASVLAQYPISRVRRVEFSVGARRIGFASHLETQFYSPSTGQFLGETRETLPHDDALNFGEATAALEYDSSVFGATGPLVGKRYRFELSHRAGTLNYSGALLDYRKYFMPRRPFTLALRGLHYGRYGGGAEDLRLPPLYLGYPGLVRGYDLNSFDASECQEVDLVNCSAFAGLTGSRLALAGAEVRFPVFGLFGHRSFYGPFPLEMALFAEGGVAWTSDTKPKFAGGERILARSAGVALRANVLGYAIAEIAFVRPLDRARRGWVWQFGLTPGF